MRIALGVSYNGQNYHGWQSQPNGNTVQDHLEKALSQIAGQHISTLCAGRTDSGVHALQQVVHFDTAVQRPEMSWVRGVNALMPKDIAVQWVRVVPENFHCRSSAKSRRYAYVLLQSPVRPSIEFGRVGWSFLALDSQAMEKAAHYLLGEHDFSAFRAAACQSITPVKNIASIQIRHTPIVHTHTPSVQTNKGVGTCYWRFDFEANAFLHHMIRNIMGCLIAIGQGIKPPEWMQEVLHSRSRQAAAPTFSPDGLYFLGPQYDAQWNLPVNNALFATLPLAEMAHNNHGGENCFALPPNH